MSSYQAGHLLRLSLNRNLITDDESGKEDEGIVDGDATADEDEDGRKRSDCNRS